MTKITPRNVLVSNGSGNFIKTFFAENDAVKPGHIVSGTAAGQGACDWADAANDVPIGVALCMPGQDIDVAYTAGVSFPVAVCSSGAEVWVRFKTSGGALAAGSLVMHDGATAANGLALLGTEGLYEVIGRTAHLHDDIASESWVLVRLST